MGEITGFQLTLAFWIHHALLANLLEEGVDARGLAGVVCVQGFSWKKTSVLMGTPWPLQELGCGKGCPAPSRKHILKYVSSLLLC